MSCIEKPFDACAPAGAQAFHPYRCVIGSSLVLLLALAGCSSSPPPAPSSNGATAGSVVEAPSPSTGGVGKSQPSVSGGAPDVLGPPRTPRSHAELRRQAAQRLVAANPDRSYMGTVPDILLAIPVLEVELKADGQVKQIKVLRRPGQALDTVQLAMDAVHRAAPFGNVAALPKPWVFSETFLFNDQRKFKPRTLDE